MRTVEEFMEAYGCDRETATAYINKSKAVSEELEKRLAILRNNINQNKKAKVANKIGRKKLLTNKS